MHDVFDGPLPDGWSGGAPVTKYWNGDYIHLYRVTRPCATCSAEISLDVTKKALQGSTKNAGLLLRNCPQCRAERKAGGPGSRGGKSRPTVDAPATPVQADTGELERLRMMVATMKAELDPLYARVREQFEEIQQLKARLAKYELQPAMGELQKVTASNGGLHSHMPWE